MSLNVNISIEYLVESTAQTACILNKLYYVKTDVAHSCMTADQTGRKVTVFMI
jgi:hypothetical protein